MREILFRGKRTDNGEWIKGYYASIGEYHYILTGQLALVPYLGFEHFLVNPDTVGRFTGLTDKNGTKIFEGDIVKYDEELYSVVYEPDVGMFELCGDGFAADFSYIDSSIFCEVVSNIHDNPELMEVSGNE